MRSQVEVERTFSPPAEAGLPDLTQLDAVDAMHPGGDVQLDATYFDTPDLALLRAGVTLRRRLGGADEGWHLKLPLGAPGAREEVHHPVAEPHEPPPAALLWLIDGWTRGGPVAPVARIRTLRSTTRLVAADGRVLAELADDRVEGRPDQPGAEPRAWREWEVELVTGDPELLDRVEAVFARYGVPRSQVQRKVSLVLGATGDEAADQPAPTKDDPAGQVVETRLGTQVEALARLDPVVRRGGEGGVHGFRKACRRLRAALATYRPLFDRELTDPVREELGWLARALGTVRDDEVVTDRIALLVGEQDGDLVVGPVLDRLAARRRRTLEREEQVVVEVLGSERYLALRAELDRLVAAPPWTPLAARPAREVLPRQVRREWRRLRGVHRDAEDPHEVRKAAKRLRYAYEVVAPWWAEAAAPEQAAKELTQLLGDRQDAVVAMAVLVELAQEATDAGESAFTYGRLHAQQERRAGELLEDADRVWRELDRVRW